MKENYFGFSDSRWKPNKSTIDKIKYSLNRTDAYKCFRASSSAYIKRSDIKGYIFNRDGNKCVLCGEKINLSIDHILSVYRCFHKEAYFDCNTTENLQTLCIKCNSSKLP